MKYTWTSEGWVWDDPFCSMSYIFNPSIGTPTPPPVAGNYVSEDGMNIYSTEDLLSHYITEV